MKYLDGIVGLVVGDALGSPAQFFERGMVKITEMIPCGTYNTPAGAWTDDSSMALATLDSIVKLGKIDVKDISDRFANWLYHGWYTPFGYAYDVGATCSEAIKRYKRTGTISGLTSENSNGNGSLMRIMPACLFAKKVEDVEQVSKITHAHRRSQIGCGLYYFIVQEILHGKKCLRNRISDGLSKGFEWYKDDPELDYYSRMRNVDEFAKTLEDDIESTGYIVHTFEASIWCLLNTGSYRDAVLKAVNLGYDADSVGAVCGGLAGLYYGFDSIPEEWTKYIWRLDWIKELCNKAESMEEQYGI